MKPDAAPEGMNRCSRCRRQFPTTDGMAGTQDDWWLCDPCHHKLIGSRTGAPR